MADAQPFRAVRYAGAAGALADLVAPPYDAVDDVQRAALFARSPYNVLHLTLPESADAGARLYREWLTDGILARDDDAGTWVVAESYVGPDGVARERRGRIVSLPATPYESGAVLPHERTYARTREDRLDLLRATRVQPEPIFLLSDASLDASLPTAAPDLEVEGTRLWRVGADGAELGQLLVADGHHRYESALALSAESGDLTRIMALVVSKDDRGLHVFPTHRVFRDRPDLAESRDGDEVRDLDEALGLLSTEPHDPAVVVAYRRGRVELARAGADELDVELVDRHGLAGIAYTHRVEEAVGAVDRATADVAYLLRDPRVDDVFAVARRGERMPPKSTYFFPKPLSGLLFHSLDP